MTPNACCLRFQNINQDLFNEKFCSYCPHLHKILIGVIVIKLGQFKLGYGSILHLKRHFQKRCVYFRRRCTNNIPYFFFPKKKMTTPRYLQNEIGILFKVSTNSEAGARYWNFYNDIGWLIHFVLWNDLVIRQFRDCPTLNCCKMILILNDL